MKTVLKSCFARLPGWLQRPLKRGLEARAVRARHRAAMRNLVQAAVELSAQSLEMVRTLPDWQKRRETSRRQLFAMLGLEPLPERTPLRARITGTIERPAYRIEKIVFESRPGLFVTANLYLPRERSGPVPAIVYLNGHWPTLDGAKTGYQDRYLWYPANGFALLVVDPLGYGEIPGIHPGTNKLNRWDWISRGYTPAGVEVWNAIRALDYLETRPEVDSARIGATGISGGGVMTQYWAALDERVAVAAPSCSTFTIGDQVANDLVLHQCDCTYYPNVHRLDFPEVLALIAPRPLLILGGRKDMLFPPAGFRAAFRKTQRIYGLYEPSVPGGSRIRLVESNAGHTDPPHFLAETRQWMCRWLLGREDVPAAQTGAVPPPEAPETLRCLDACPPSARNSRIHDEWIARPAGAVPATPAAADRRKAELLEVLRTQVLAEPVREAVPFRTRRLAAGGGRAGQFAAFGEYEFDVEPAVPVKISLLMPDRAAKTNPLVIWVRSPGEPVLFPDLDEFFPLLRTHALAILTPRFSERPLTGREHAAIERTAVLTGRSLAALRTWDVRRALAWVVRDRGLAPAEIATYGRGEAGIAGLYAALLEPGIGHVVLRDPPVSHLDAAALPTILRHADVDEMLGLLAPRRVTLLSRRPEAYALAREYYRLADASAAFRSAADVAAAFAAPAPKGAAPC
ncbi:MAG: alpha/beta hydrolase [Kiritimatiellia bacterium]